MALINKLTNIGNAIREKTGDTKKYTLEEMASTIVNLPTGGGFDISALNYVEIKAPSIYSNYSTLPDLTPYVNNIDKIVAMFWCGVNNGEVYVYFRGIKDYRVFVLRNIYGIKSEKPLFITPTNNPYNYYFIDGNLSGLKVKTSSNSTISLVFSNGLVMLYED